MSDDDSINQAIQLLQSQGYVVTRPEWGPWINATELHAQFSHLSRTAFHNRLRNFGGDYPKNRGPKGNLRRLRTSPDLMAWLGRPIKQGERNDL